MKLNFNNMTKIIINNLKNAINIYHNVVKL